MPGAGSSAAYVIMRRLLRVNPLIRLLRPNFTLLVVLLFTAAGGIAGYWWGEHIAEQKTVQHVTERADFYRRQLGSLLNRYELTPDAAQACPCVKNLLKDPDNKARIDYVNRVFEDMATRTKVAAVYLMAPDGTTIAASNWNTTGSFLGKNYGIRPYFKTAMMGELGRYVAIGITSRKLGYYVAKPVFEEGVVLGVVVVKVGLDKPDQWRPEEIKQSGLKVVLTDEDGITFLASESEWQYRPVNALSEEELQALQDSRRYEGSDFKVLPIQQIQSLDTQNRLVRVGINGAMNYISHRTPLSDTGWHVETFMPLSSYRDVIYRYTTFGAISALALALFLNIFLVRETYRQELLNTAIRDPLTGFYTRLYMNEIAPTIIARRARYPDEELSAILFDMDHFKQINDKYSHIVGDEVLQVVGQALLGQLRATDIAIRYGGEELLVFTTGSGLEEAAILAERIRKHVESLQVQACPEVYITVTLSAGVAAHHPGETLEDLLKRADSKLYEAKENGRNNVQV